MEITLRQQYNVGVTNPLRRNGHRTTEQPAYQPTSMFAYDSITVSSAWELISVSMSYSQVNRSNTSLYSLMYCTHALLTYILPYILRTSLFPCLVFVCGCLPWHGYVLPGTTVKRKCLYTNYISRDKSPAPI